MDTVFGGLRDTEGEEFCSAFIDEINVTTVKAHDVETDEETDERHAEHLELFLTKALEKKISFKLVKCKWLQKRVQLLGFDVGNGTRRVDPKKAQALREWPDASEQGDVSSMRAFANYIREYIPDFAEHDRYLRPYLKKGAKFSDYAKDEKAQAAYAALRQACAEDAELASIDYAAAAEGIAGGRPLERKVFLRIQRGSYCSRARCCSCV